MSSPKTLHPVCDRLRAVFAVPLIAYLLVPAPLLAQSVSVVVAPDSGNTRSYDTTAGTAVVDIDTPNEAGLSHNRFTQFNVPEAGLILNNAAPSDFTTPSQITGEVLVNFNLSPEATASVILNEVVAPNVSTIAGFTEVTGDAADVIIANPNGISVQGGGFLNTNRVTLSTGSPVLAADGSLATLRVDQGQLVIGGTGLDASNLDFLNLLGRSIFIDGPVHANDLAVTTGVFDYDYPAESVSARAAAGTVPTYAVDSSLLGGMYADRIRLLATESGVGVRLLGDVAATVDDFTIDASGRVQLSGRAYAERDLLVNAAAGIEISGNETSLAAVNDIVLDGMTGSLEFANAEMVAGADLSLAGASLTDISDPGVEGANRFGMSGIDINIGGAAVVEGSVYGSATSLDFSAGAIAMGESAGIYAGADETASANTINLSTTTGDLDTGNAAIRTPGAINLTAAQGAVITANSEPGTGIAAGTDLTIRAATMVDSAGTLIAGGDFVVGPVSTGGTPLQTTNRGNWQAVGDITLNEVGFTNTDTGVVLGRTLDITAATMTNDGAMQGTEGVTVSVEGLFTTGEDSVLMSDGDPGNNVVLNAGSVSSAGLIQSTGTVDIQVDDFFNNDGVVVTLGADQGGTDGTVTLNALAVNNTGTIASAADFDLAVGVQTTSTVTNSGTLQAVGNFDINVGAGLTNTATGQILAGGDLVLGTSQAGFTLSNSGRLQADGAVTVGEVGVLLTFTQAAEATLIAGRSLQVQTTTFGNFGTLQSGGALSLSATEWINNREGGAILTAGLPGLDLTINASDLNNAGRVQSTGLIDLTANGIVNTGVVISQTSAEGGVGGPIRLNTQRFFNDGTLRSGGDLNLVIAEGFNNGANGALIAVQDFSLLRGAPGTVLVDNQGRFESGENMVIGAADQPVEYQGGPQSVILAGGTLDIMGNQWTSAGAVQSGGNALFDLSADLTNSGSIYIGPETVANFKIESRGIDNSGSITVSGDLDIDLSSTFANTGSVQAGGVVDVIAPLGFTNVGNLLSSGNMNLQSGQGAFAFVNSGNVQSGGSLQLGTSGALAEVTNSANASFVAADDLQFLTSSLDSDGLVQAGTLATISAASDVIFGTTGALVTAGTAGADIQITSDDFTNSGAVQSAGDIMATVSDTLLNSGSIVTLATSAGGSDGDLTTVSRLFTNTGSIAVAGDINITTTENTATSLTNSGVIEASGNTSLLTPFGLINNANATIAAGGTLSIQGGGAFDLLNSGTLQSGQGMTLGLDAARVALENTSTGLINAGQTVAILASTLTNAGTVQAGTLFDLNVTGLWNNQGTVLSQILAGTVGSAVNSGSITALDDFQLTSGSSFTNSGLVEAADQITLVVPQFFTNTGTGEMVAGGTLDIQSGAVGFNVTNTGTIQSGAATTIGTAGAEVLFTQDATGQLLAGSTLGITASGLTNSGTLQSGNQQTLTVSGAMVNNAGGDIVTTASANADLVITADSMVNDGTVQSSGAATATLVNGLTNTGSISTLAVADGGVDGAIELTSASLTNSGTVSSASSLAVANSQAASTSLTNTGTLQSATNTTITTAGGLSNAANSLILAGTSLDVQSGAGDFDFTNDGTVQSGEAMTVGTTGAEVTLDNQTNGLLISGTTVNVVADSVTNSGTAQAGGAMIIGTTGAMVNNTSGRIIGTSSSDEVTLNVNSLTNAGTIQAAGGLDANVVGAAINSGNIVTTNDRAIAFDFATLNNSGTITSDGSATLVVGNSLTNTSTGVIDADATLSFNNGNNPFTLTNEGAINTEADLQLGLAGGRAEVTNAAGGLMLAGSTADVWAQSITNAGTLQSGSTLTVNASGNITNQSTGVLLNVGSTPAAVSLTATDVTNAGTVETTGTLGVTASGATTNSGTVIARDVFTLETATLNNSGTIEVLGDANLNASGAGPNAVINSGTLLSTEDLTLTVVGGVSNQGGSMQATGKVAVGSSTQRGAFANTSGGSVVGGDTVDFLVTLLDNAGVIQAADQLTLNATGAVTNTGSAAVMRTINAGAAIDLDADSLTSSGFLVSADQVDVNVSTTLNNSGTVVSANGSSLALTGAGVTNSGTLQSGSTATVSATDFTNSGTLATAGNLTATTTQSFANNAGGLIDVQGTFTQTGFTTGATGSNAGTIQSTGALNLNAPTGSADWTNSGQLLTNTTLTAASTNFTNSGTMQSEGALTVTTTAALANQAGGRILNVGATPAAVNLSGGSFNNAGAIQANSDLTLNYSGAAASSGTILSAGPLSITADTINQSGVVDVTGDAILTGTGTAAATVTNSGTLLTSGNLTIVAPQAFDNDTSSARISTGGNLVINAAVAGDIRNDGLMQATGTLGLGNATQRAALTTTAGSSIVGADTVTLRHSSVTNGGTIQAAGNLVFDATGAVNNNDANALITSTGSSNPLTITGASLTNAGTIQSANTLAVTVTNEVNNSGKLLTPDGLDLTVQGTALTNSGVVQSGNDVTLTGTSLVNSGTVHANRDLLVNTSSSFENTSTGVLDADNNLTHAGFTVGSTGTNAGTIQADAAVTFSAPGTSANWTNSGTILAGTTFTGTASQFTNSGTVQSSGVLGVTTTGAFDNQAAGRILTSGTAGSDVTLTTGEFTNAGTIQSSGDIVANATGNAANSGTMLTLNGAAGGDSGVLKVDATGSFTNSGTIDGASTVDITAGTTFTNSGSDALIAGTGLTTLTTGTAFTTDAGSEIIGDVGVNIRGNSGFTLTNSGRLQAGAELAVGTSAAPSAVTNNATGVLFGDDVTLNVTSLSNAGTIQATDDVTVTFAGTGQTFTNDATGQVMAGDALTVGAAGNNFNLTNSGLLQSGGAMTLGTSGHIVNLTNNVGAKLIADGLNIDAGTISNAGSISATSPSTINTGDFTNSGSSSKVVFAHGTGTSAINYTGTATNEGVLFSQSNLSVTGGANLTNAATGGISTLGDLSLGASNNITNEGALYTAGSMTLNAGNKVFNAKAGTIDSDNNLNVTAGEFENQGQVNVAGNADFSVGTFRNVDNNLNVVNQSVPSWMQNQLDHDFMPLMFAELFRNFPVLYSNPAAAADPANHDRYILTFAGGTRTFNSSGGPITFQFLSLRSFDVDYIFQDGNYVTDPASVDVSNRAQVAAGNLTIRDFNYALNQGNLNTPGTMTITGANGSANFVNDSISLNRTEFKTDAWVVFDNQGETWRITDVLLDPNPVTTTVSSGTYFSLSADVRAGNLVVSNASVTNKGSPLGPSSTASGSSSAESRSALGNAATATGATSASASSAASLSPDSLLGSLGLAAVNGNTAAGELGFGTATAAGSGGSALTFSTPSGQQTVVASTVVAIEALAAAGAADPVAFQQLLATTLAVLDGGTYAIGALPADVEQQLAEALAGFSLPGDVALADAIAALQALGAAARLPIARGGSVTLGSLTLDLPTNPNGFFVVSPDPQARFRVTVNEDLGISSDAVGSDFLARELGYNPDEIQTRLGDPAYETYLVRQQLVDQLGTQLLAGQTDETSQMEALMRSAAEVQDNVGLVWGQAPTTDQLRNLDRDIVWMVSQVIDGEELLVPQVYLSDKTRAMFNDGSATIAATDSATMDVTNLSNVGGNITAGNNLSINASGDVENVSGQMVAGGDLTVTAGGNISNRRLNADQSTTDNRLEALGQAAAMRGGNVTLDAGGNVENLSASISGGDVSIQAGGDITNRTYAEVERREGTMRTTIGETASIDATGDLALQAGNDINIVGADVRAGGDGSIAAGGDVVVDTIQDVAQTTTTTSSRGGFMGTKRTTTTTTVTNVQNIGSTIDIGGDATLSSGGDTTIAGSDLNVAGNLTAQTGGDLNIVDRQDRTITNSVSEESGLFVGGGLVGTQTTTINDDLRTSVGSSVDTARNATLTAGGGITIVGSDVNVGGDADMTATDIIVAEGRNSRDTTTVVETTTFGIFTDSGASASSGAQDAGIPGSTAGEGQAAASASGDLTIGMRTQTTTTVVNESTGTASSLNIGGNATINATNDLIVQGSDIDVGGDLDMQAENMSFLEGRDTRTVSQNVETTTLGVSFTGSAEAEAQGRGSAGSLGVEGQGSAGAEAEVGVGLKAQQAQSFSSTTTDNARVSTINVGGNMTRTATGEIKDVGTDIVVGGDLTQSAETITSLAATNTVTTTESASVDTARLGFYADASASGSGTAAGGSGAAEGKAAASAGVKGSYTATDSAASASSSTAVVSNIQTGGNFSSTSTGTTTFEGTNITAGGSASLAAGSLDFRAAENTTTADSSSSSFSAEAKLGKGASADASTTGGSSGGGGAQGSLSASASSSRNASSSSTAVVGGINAGGNLTITTTDDARFEGTNLQGGGDTTIDVGGDLTFDAARSTTSSSSSGMSGEATLSGGATGNSLAAEGQMGSSSSASNTAVTGSIGAGNNLTIRSGGDATFEGTDVTAGGDAAIAAQGDVTFNQATSTSSSESFGASAGVSMSDGDKDSGGSFSANANVGSSQTASSTAQTSTLSAGGGLTISSGNDVTLQGADVDAGGAINLNAGGDINLTAAEESSSASGFSVGASVQASGSSGSGDSQQGGGGFGMVRGAVGSSESTTRTGTTLSGSQVNLQSGGDTTLVGTQANATSGDVTVQAGGSVEQQAAVSSSSTQSVGGAVTAAGTAAVTTAVNESDTTSQETSLESDNGNVSVQENTPPEEEENAPESEDNGE